jgi:DtxR family Mn-dependent transcriptional regulator
MTAISASLEDYLEAIYHLEETHKVARSKDIAERLGVTKSSVTSALKQLNAAGFINYDPYSFVTLTDRGREEASRVARRHELLARFLHEVLGMDPAAADENACRIEHAVDTQAIRRLDTLMRFYRSESQADAEWVDRLREEME